MVDYMIDLRQTAWAALWRCRWTWTPASRSMLRSTSEGRRCLLLLQRLDMPLYITNIYIHVLLAFVWASPTCLLAIPSLESQECWKFSDMGVLEIINGLGDRWNRYYWTSWIPIFIPATSVNLKSHLWQLQPPPLVGLGGCVHLPMLRGQPWWGWYCAVSSYYTHF